MRISFLKLEITIIRLFPKILAFILHPKGQMILDDSFSSAISTLCTLSQRHRVPLNSYHFFDYFLCLYLHCRTAKRSSLQSNPWQTHIMRMTFLLSLFAGTRTYNYFLLLSFFSICHDIICLFFGSFLNALS